MRGETRRRRAAPVGFLLAIVGLAGLLVLSGSAVAAGLADGGFESGVLGGPFPTAPLPPSVGLWTRTSDDSHLVDPTGLVHTGNWALEVDTRTSVHGSAVYQDFDSGTLSYNWTFWVYPSDGTNVAELIYNWDRGSLGRAESGSSLTFTPTETRFNGWNGNTTFPVVPAGGWHEIKVFANRCSGVQEVRLDGATWGTVTAVTAPPAGNATMILGDVAFNALHGLYHYDDVVFELFDCSAPQKKPCPLSPGFWKNHPGAWPVGSLVLGDETYAKAELLLLLKTPTRGDASLILVRQLLAAKLNIANGSDPTPILQTISDADVLLAPFTGRLPYHVRPFSGVGHSMTALADRLEKYNGGGLTPDCVGCHDGDDKHGNHDGEHEHEDGCGCDREDRDDQRGRHHDDCGDRERPGPKPPSDLPAPLADVGVSPGSSSPPGSKSRRGSIVA